MKTGERLAAYLAGELGTDETRALEAELARDPSLRARLEAIRSTDAALASLPPVELPDGFSARLREAVAAELDGTLPAEGDELAARRARRAGRAGGATRSWWPQVAVAAAVLAVAGIGIAQLGGMGGADDVAMEADAGGETMETMALPAAGPTVVSDGRSFDAESLRDLAGDPRFAELTSQDLAGDGAEAAADSYGTALTAPGGADDSNRIASDEADGMGSAADAPQETAALESEDIGLRTEGDVTEEDLERVRTCLDELETETTVIPVYAELVDFEGQDAIVYGFVGNDPEQDSYRRVELWVVGRGDCQVLHFTQVDR